MSERIKWIDACKGIAIILVIVGHLIGDNIVNRFILSFHMPVFFFVSGFLSENSINCSFGKYTIKKVKSLLIPQFFLLIFTYLFDGFAGKTDWHIGLDVLFSAWFLWVLFYDEILWFFVSKVLIGVKERTIILLFDILVILITCFYDIHTGFNIEIMPMSFLFFLAGNYSMNNKQIITNFSELIKIKYWWPLICPIVFILARKNPLPAYMYLNSYGNIYIFITSALLGIIMTVLCAKRICVRFYYIDWIGRNSIIFYIFNFALVDLTHIIQYKYLSLVFPYVMTTYLGKFVFYSVSLVFILTILSVITIIVRKRPLINRKKTCHE